MLFGFGQYIVVALAIEEHRARTSERGGGDAARPQRAAAAGRQCNRFQCMAVNGPRRNTRAETGETWRGPPHKSYQKVTKELQRVHDFCILCYLFAFVFVTFAFFADGALSRRAPVLRQ